MKRHIFDLRPTQFALGLKEVQAKVAKIKKLTETELHDYLHSHPVPVVICKDGNVHVIDHHHLIRACWELGILQVVTHVVEDLSSHAEQGFWKKMRDSKWVHLFDQFGNGPHDPSALPLDVRGLADDVYRSLAWAVREEGGFEKTEIPFAEFKWADFFRKRIVVTRTAEGFEAAKLEALKLCKSPAAANLPGFKSTGS